MHSHPAALAVAAVAALLVAAAARAGGPPAGPAGRPAPVAAVLVAASARAGAPPAGPAGGPAPVAAELARTFESRYGIKLLDRPPAPSKWAAGQRLQATPLGSGGAERNAERHLRLIDEEL